MHPDYYEYEYKPDKINCKSRDYTFYLITLYNTDVFKFKSKIDINDNKGPWEYSN